MSRFTVEQFVEKPNKDFICSICWDVFDEPTETPCCHIFCKNCIETVHLRNSKCPMCRCPFLLEQLQPTSDRFNSGLCQLKLRCKNEECQRVVKLENYLSHIAVCREKLDMEEFLIRYKKAEEEVKRLGKEASRVETENTVLKSKLKNLALMKQRLEFTEREVKRLEKTIASQNQKAADMALLKLENALAKKELGKIKVENERIRKELGHLRDESVTQKQTLKSYVSISKANVEAQIEIENLRQENSAQRPEIKHLMYLKERSDQAMKELPHIACGQEENVKDVTTLESWMQSKQNSDHIHDEVKRLREENSSLHTKQLESLASMKQLNEEAQNEVARLRNELIAQKQLGKYQTHNLVANRQREIRAKKHDFAHSLGIDKKHGHLQAIMNHLRQEYTKERELDKSRDAQLLRDLVRREIERPLRWRPAPSLDVARNRQHIQNEIGEDIAPFLTLTFLLGLVCGFVFAGYD